VTCIIAEKKANDFRSRVEKPAHSRGAASFLAQGEAVLREPWVYGRFYAFFPNHRPQTPLAEAAPTREVGIERRAQGNVLSSEAVFARRCDTGQWRLRGVE